MFVAAAGTVAAIMNPSLIQQGTAFFGIKLSQNTTDPNEKGSGEDQLSQFLAQYPFANNRDNAVVPTANVPTVVIPEPASPVNTAPTYAQSWDSADWDNTATEPIDTPLSFEQPSAPVTDWSGPSQPYQVSIPTISVSPQSVYAPTPQEDVFPVVQNVPGYSQTSYVPPTTQPLMTPLTQPVPPSATLQAPATLIESVPIHGTETVARVGTQVILMGDVLPKLRRTALKIINENIKKMPEEERAKVTLEEVEQFTKMVIERNYPDILEEQIMFALVYNDYDVAQDRASKAGFNDKMGEEFDHNEIPEMLKEFNVENIAALKRFLEEQLGSSLEKERRLWIREQIVKQWIGMSMQRATGECTQDEMMDFYERNTVMFTSVARVRWQEMVVLLSSHQTEEEAWNKIRWMGNQVASGAPFEEIAKANSDGFTASEGGVWDWTTKGSLTSTELEQAIFSQPRGQLSPAIIRSDKGLHIVQVLERQEAKVVPYREAQATIREKIKNQRAQRYQDEYFTDLRRRFPTVIVKERIDFDINGSRTAGR